MKLKILSLAKQEKGSTDLPGQFSEKVRPDLIKRAVVAVLANKRQPYGASPEAGKKYVFKVSKRRRKYRGTYGHGTSRTPRKVITRRGTQFRYTGAFAPQTVGGREAHPPKAEKIWSQKVNKKERRKAIRSAMAATLVKDLVAEKGHIMPENYPFIIESKIESVEKTKDLVKALEKIGFESELERTANKKIRAGKGKSRGRKYKKTRGMLIVVSEKCALSKAGKNIPGVEIAEVKKLSAEILAPGAVPGRMALFTEKAIELMGKEKLFTEEQEKPKKEEKEVKKAEPKKEKPTKKTEKKKTK